MKAYLKKYKWALCLLVIFAALCWVYKTHYSTKSCLLYTSCTKAAAAHGFLRGLRLCERSYIENKTAGICKFAAEKQKNTRRGVF